MKIHLFQIELWSVIVYLLSIKKCLKIELWLFLLRKGLISTLRIGFINILYNFGFQNSYKALSLSLSCTGFRSTFLFRKILAFLKSILTLKIHTLLPLLLVGNFFCSCNWKGHWNSNGMPCGVTLGFKATWNNFVTEWHPTYLHRGWKTIYNEH